MKALEKISTAVLEKELQHRKYEALDAAFDLFKKEQRQEFNALEKECNKLINGIKYKVETPDAKISFFLRWDTDSEPTIDIDDVTRKKGGIMVVTHAIYDYLSNDPWAILEIPEASKIYNAFNKRITTVCKTIDKFNKKYDINLLDILI
jgi:hypothetical protein